MKNLILNCLTILTISTIGLLLNSCHTDMTAIRMVFPDLVNDGEIIEVTQVSGNIGKQASASNNVDFDITDFRDGLYLSVDQHLGINDVVLKENLVDLLQPGQLFQATNSVEIPFGTRTGDYYLLFNVNQVFGGLEPNQSDNLIAEPITINGFSNAGRDLIPINFKVEKDLLAESQIRIFWTACNFGQSAVPTSEVKYYLSNNPTLEAGEDLCIGSSTVAALDGFEKREYSFSPFIQNDNFGYKYLLIVMDETNTITEFNEENNVNAQRIYLRERRPDLEITTFEAPIGVQTNVPILLNTRVRNSGTKSSGNFKLQYILSVDASVGNNDDITLSSINLGGQSMSSSTIYNHFISIPANVAEGAYHLFAVSDADNVLLEYSENNNRASLRICVHGDFDNLMEEDDTHQHEEARQHVDVPIFARGTELTENYIREFVSEQMKVYPNPTRHQTNLELTILRDAEVAIYLRDAMGQSLFSYQGKMEKGKNLKSINLRDYPSGMYLIQVELEDQRFSKTIILE